MANRNTGGFGLKAAMRTGNTPSIQGQSKYDIDAGETNAIFNGEPVKVDISATTGGYIVTAAAGTAMVCLLYTSPSPRDGLLSRMPSSA